MSDRILYAAFAIIWFGIGAISAMTFIFYVVNL